MRERPVTRPSRAVLGRRVRHLAIAAFGVVTASLPLFAFDRAAGGAPRIEGTPSPALRVSSPLPPAVGAGAAPTHVALVPIEAARAPSDAHDSPESRAPVAPLAPGRVVFVTIDGVRWEDALDPVQGPALLPNLHRAVRERGAVVGGPDCANDVRASGPGVSFPGYVEMFTGVSPAGCFDNSCAAVAAPTVVDDVRAELGSKRDVAVFASWSTYARAVVRDGRSIVLSAGANGRFQVDDPRLRALLDAGAAKPGYPGHGDYRPDVHTAAVALRYLAVARPRVLVLGLGDPDEYAHRWDFAGYRKSIRFADEVLGMIDETLAASGDLDRTTVVVTTDHGRAKSIANHGVGYPESTRVFVAAYGAGVTRRGAVCIPRAARLGHIPGLLRVTLGSARPGSDVARNDNPLVATFFGQSALAIE